MLRTHFKSSIIALLALATFASSAARANSGVFSPEFTSAFTEACVEEDAHLQAYCGCVMKKIDRELDAETAQQVMYGELDLRDNPVFTGATSACANAIPPQ